MPSVWDELDEISQEALRLRQRLLQISERLFGTVQSPASSSAVEPESDAPDPSPSPAPIAPLKQPAAPVASNDASSLEPFSIDSDLKTRRSPLTAVDIDGLLDDRQSPLAGIGKAVIAAATKYRINATYIVAHAALESGWGTSRICREKNNLFGWGAFDATPWASSKAFPDRETCIDFVMARVADLYLSPTGKYYRGPFLGNKSKGMNVFYASDPNWGSKIARIAQELEEDLVGDGHQDATKVFLTPHFTLEEIIRSATADKYGIDNTLPPHLYPNAIRVCEFLEAVRARLGRGFTPAQVYRSPLLTEPLKREGYKPAANSKHAQALAADLPRTPEMWAAITAAAKAHPEPVYVLLEDDPPHIHVALGQTQRSEVRLREGAVLRNWERVGVI